MILIQISKFRTMELKKLEIILKWKKVLWKLNSGCFYEHHRSSLDIFNFFNYTVFELFNEHETKK